MKTDPKGHIDLMILLKVSLGLGICKPEIVVRFAEDIIRREEEPDYLFIELAMCGENKNKMISLLREFTLDYQREKAVAGGKIFSKLRKDLIDERLSLENVVMLLSELRTELSLTEKEEHFIYYIDDQLYLAEECIIEPSILDVRRELLVFLEGYAEKEWDIGLKWGE